MEAQVCSKLPLEVFILPQPCSTIRRNSYWNQPLFLPSKKIYLDLSRRIWMQVFIPLLTKMNDYTPGSFKHRSKPHLFGSCFNRLTLSPC